jgi:cytochrome P450
MKRCTAPHLPGHFLFGNLLQFRRDTLATLASADRDCGPIAQLALGPERLLFINDPAMIREVLVERPHAYSRRSNLEARWLRTFLGDGLLTTDCDLWLRLRRASHPAFSKTGVAKVIERIEIAAERALDRWPNPGSKPIDLYPELVALTAAISYYTFFGRELSREDALAVANGLLVGQEFVIGQIRIPLEIGARIPTPRNLRFQRGRRAIEAVVDRALLARLESPPTGEVDDMLGILLADRHGPDGAPLSPIELREQVLTNFVAAPENAATALTWSLYLLSRHEETAREVERGDRGLLDRVVQETLRLYPGTPLLDRRALEDTEIGGHFVPRGMVVMISPYILQRTERFWEAPDRFRPERFLDPNLRSSPAYIPFGLGPRRCIGDRFALSMLGVVLPMLLSRFEIEPADSADLQIQPMINLRPRGGFQVRLSWKPAGKLRAMSA